MRHFRPMPREQNAGLSAVAQLVRRSDPDRFFTALFAPPAHRETLLLLYALNHELARAREVVSEPMLALIRLQWWRDVVLGARRRHEVAGPLGEALDSGTLQAAPLLAMIEAREVEADPAIATRADFLRYVHGTAGGLAAAAGAVLGADEALLARLDALGSCVGIAGQLRNVGALARQHRCLLPLDVLGAHGLVADAVTAGQAGDRLAPVLADLAAEGLALFRVGRGRFPRAVVAAALPAVLARRDLRHPGVAPLRRFADRAAVCAAAAIWRV